MQGPIKSVLVDTPFDKTGEEQHEKKRRKLQKLTPAAARLKPAASEVVAPSMTNPAEPSRSVTLTTAEKVAAPKTTMISPAAEDAPHAPTITSSYPSPLTSL